MNHPEYSRLMIYGIFIVAGIIGTAGDVLTYQWAKSQHLGYLLGACALWITCLALMGYLMQMERYSFGAVVVLTTISNILLSILWSFSFLKLRPSLLEWSGVILAIISVLLIEIGRERTAVAQP